MSVVLEILNRLAATSKRNEKISILQSLTADEATLFKQAAIATYASEHDFYVKVYPRSVEHKGTLSLAAAIYMIMAELATRKLTGHAALKFLNDLDSQLSEGDAEVLNRIIERDLKCGASESTANKVWPDLIYVHPYKRCSSFNEANLKNIKFPCFSQRKEDGQYVDIMVDSDGVVTYKSRNNKTYAFNHPETDAKFSKYPGNVFMGETLVMGEDGNILPRTEGNGYLNNDDIDPSRLVFMLWDIVPMADFVNRRSAIEYQHSFHTLKTIIVNMKTVHVRLIDTRVVNSVQEIIDHFKENLLAGKEGTVIKNFTTVWFDGDAKDQIKCKIEFTCELKVVGIKEGINSNVGKLGAFECESDDGLVKVFVGGGFKKDERAKFFTPEMIGSIIEVKANDIVQDRNDLTVYSLFLPRYTKLRKDKTKADTYERILEQKQAFIELLQVIQTT